MINRNREGGGMVTTLPAPSAFPSHRTERLVLSTLAASYDFTSVSEQAKPSRNFPINEPHGYLGSNDFRSPVGRKCGCFVVGIQQNCVCVKWKRPVTEKMSGERGAH